MTVGITIDLADPTKNTTNGIGDVYKSIENLLGSNLNDVLFGDAGNNRLDGAQGHDILIGRGGNDFLRDTGPGTDDYASYQEDGLAGPDRQGHHRRLLGKKDSSRRTPGRPRATPIQGIEGLIGSQFDDALYGNGGNNFLAGGKGNDTLDGKGGGDTASYQFSARRRETPQA